MGGVILFLTNLALFQKCKIRKKNMTPPHFLIFHPTSQNQAGKFIYQFFSVQVTVLTVLGIISYYWLVLGWPKLLGCINSNIPKKIYKKCHFQYFQCRQQNVKKCPAGQNKFQKNVKKMSRRIKKLFKNIFWTFLGSKMGSRPNRPQPQDPPPHFR